MKQAVELAFYADPKHIVEILAAGAVAPGTETRPAIPRHACVCDGFCRNRGGPGCEATGEGEAAVFPKAGYCQNFSLVAGTADAISEALEERLRRFFQARGGT